MAEPASDEQLQVLIDEVKGLRDDLASLPSPVYSIDDVHQAVEALGDSIREQVDRLLGVLPGNFGTDLGDLQRTLENIERSIDNLDC